MKELIEKFKFEGDFVSYTPFGNGHINDTYHVHTTKNDYIIQRINHDIFKHVDQLMTNFRLVTDYLKSVVEHPNLQTLTIIPTIDGKDYLEHEGSYYRALWMIPDSFSYDVVKDAEDLYKTGLAFGNFQVQLQHFDATLLYETIPNFHNTPSRLQDFKQALAQASEERKQEAKDEIDFLLSHQSMASELYDLHLPLRVCHNDAKLNNILFSKKTNEVLAIVDLDTIMPGFVALDFGDGIRSGATHAKEDEPDLSKVQLDEQYYKSLLKGFIDGAGSCLTASEIQSLPVGARVITYEQALRFLTDYLNHDIYYKTDYPHHNLVRARTQIKLLNDLIAKGDDALASI